MAKISGSVRTRVDNRNSAVVKLLIDKNIISPISPCSTVKIRNGRMIGNTQYAAIDFLKNEKDIVASGTITSTSRKIGQNEYDFSINIEKIADTDLAKIQNCFTGMSESILDKMDPFLKPGAEPRPLKMMIENAVRDWMDKDKFAADWCDDEVAGNEGKYCDEYCKEQRPHY